MATLKKSAGGVLLKNSSGNLVNVCEFSCTNWWLSEYIYLLITSSWVNFRPLLKYSHTSGNLRYYAVEPYCVGLGYYYEIKECSYPDTGGFYVSPSSSYITIDISETKRMEGIVYFWAYVGSTFYRMKVSFLGTALTVTASDNPLCSIPFSCLLSGLTSSYFSINNSCGEPTTPRSSTCICYLAGAT